MDNFQKVTNILQLAIFAYLAITISKGPLVNPPAPGPPPQCSGHHACRMGIAKIELENKTVMAGLMKLQIQNKAHVRDFMVHLQTVKGMEFMPHNDFTDMGSGPEEEEELASKKKR